MGAADGQAKMPPSPLCPNAGRDAGLSSDWPVGFDTGLCDRGLGLMSASDHRLRRLVGAVPGKRGP